MNSVHRGGAPDFALIFRGGSPDFALILGGFLQISGGCLFLGGVPPNFQGGSFLGGVFFGAGSSKFLGGRSFLGGSSKFPGGFLQIFGGGLFLGGGSSKFSGGVFFWGGSPPEYGQRLAGTHPTGMHSSLMCISREVNLSVKAQTGPTGYQPQGEANVLTGVCLSTVGLMATRSLIGLVTARLVRLLLECFLILLDFDVDHVGGELV